MSQSQRHRQGLPGTPPSLDIVRRDILGAISGFRSVRYWMRAIALSEERAPSGTLVTPENLHSDDLSFGKTGCSSADVINLSASSRQHENADRAQPFLF